MSFGAEGESADNSTLPLFSTAVSGEGKTTFFTGGPVWAMDWLCMGDDHAGEQHVALTAYQDYDEVRR